MKYAVIGAGGMGVQYGVLLQEFAGKQVDFIDAWEPNVAAIRKQGGAYVSQDDENRHLVPIKVFYPEEYDGEPDVWIIFLKQHQLEGMLKRCAHLFHPGQIVFSAMNGYGHFEKIAQYFPGDHIYGGTALIGAFVYGPGDVNFTGGAHSKAMSMCAYDGHVSDVEHELHDDFAAATLNPTIADDFMGMCMAKIVFNSVLNTLCTMYQIRFGQFESHPAARWMTEQLVNEAYTAAEHAGLTLLGTRESEVETILHTAGVAHPLHYPSMYQDLTRCRPTEVDYINGYIAKIGREHGYVCTLHEFLTQELHLAEHAYAIHHPELAGEAA
ncbi:MAG: ketopantoate reductase family protein [Bifidobacterium tibiigranuli]|jgi:2-dehydropantoate 2-reductase|uniref:ketopantoate reductase family protein n=1 Tax=Bifidobacterium tibiigranuli TaxID=2172043 RepID=UPI0023574F03|nr:ketopantoate reductase family protein [Bifidobacterium tibiigranuli]MCH3975232.1 ketopantoate reductase family protein [Bifidobacterium tibiigranuli]MCH4203430.1 ketopantoate reductase family protein [Bifidobacterium tibiigranuli]MCH4273958.1 ketopantoate reductase family protein [Bifidobacterium tibiigranuli]